ncbi:MAG: ADP-ribosylglycohydrolase family protein [Deltaproteobacteria bacterium]|nr:ADP-ribosylglycohydrolase family protein [Deltaproteobacteria bacterium]
MLGAISGDIIGSVFEHQPVKTTEFPLFSNESTYTDDTVLTVAVAEAILKGVDYGLVIRSYGRKYPNAGYGIRFYDWLHDPNPRPYSSWGNGSAMRVSPIGFAFGTVDEVLREARRSAEITHNHPEGIKGAQSVALAVFLARSGAAKEDIKKELAGRFGYDLDRRLDDIRPSYRFDASCRGTVPEAIISFLEGDGLIGAVRNAVSLGGDSDTLAAIAGGIAEAFSGPVPDDVFIEAAARLPGEFLSVIGDFYEAAGLPHPGVDR